MILSIDNVLNDGLPLISNVFIYNLSAMSNDVE